MESYISKLTNALAFNQTQVQHQVVEAADYIARNFQIYSSAIKHWISDYIEANLLKFNSTPSFVAIVSAILVGFIIAGTSKIVSGRRRVYNRVQESRSNTSTNQHSSISSRDLQLLCEKVCQLPALKDDRQLSDLLSRTVLSFKLDENASKASSQNAAWNTSNEKLEKMEYIVEQSVKEIESLNAEITRLNSELQGIASVRDENAKVRRKCNQLLGEVAELRRKLAVASQVANNDDEIRNLEYQLLYGNTEKDKLIAKLQKEIAEKDKLLRDESSRSGTCTEESINKWLFEDCDTEYAL